MKKKSKKALEREQAAFAAAAAEAEEIRFSPYLFLKHGDKNNIEDIKFSLLRLHEITKH